MPRVILVYIPKTPSDPAQWLQAHQPPRVAIVVARRITSPATDVCNVKRDITRSDPSSHYFLFFSFITSMLGQGLHKLFRSLCFQCDEVYPICSHCKRLDSNCSLSNPDSPTDSEVVERQLNLDDLKLLHNWGVGDDTKFSDHNAEESFRAQRGREIELGFQHPYGKFLGFPSRLKHRTCVRYDTFLTKLQFVVTASESCLMRTIQANM